MILFLLIISEFDSLLLEGIHYSYKENYTESEKCFRSAMKLNPDEPAPYLLLASLYGVYMSDFSTDILEKEFFAYADSTVMIAKQKIDKGDTSGWVHLWLAGGYGTRAFYKVWRKNIISGVQDALKSIKEFYKAVEIDSSVYDAYIGIGGYNFFKYKYLSFIPWAKGEMWEEEIKLAAEKGRYLSLTATAGYALLLVEDKRYEEAAKVITTLIEKFPNTRTFRWTRAKCYNEMKAWKLARDEYKKILELVLVGQPDNFYNLAFCRMGLARAHFMLEEFAECKVQCDEIIALPDIPGTEGIKQEAEKMLKKVDI